jgi:hypothetical protein
MDLSSVFNIILSLLLLFQWYFGHAKEQSIKNNLLGIKRILDSDKKNFENTSMKEFLDATLATIGARPPFIEDGKKILDSILRRNKATANGKIRQPNENF